MTQSELPGRHPAVPTSTTPADSAKYCTACREVDWFAVAVFVGPLIERFASLPIPGTAAWCALSDHDPAKVAALLLYVRYWVFDAACRQDAERQASHDISAAADWAVIGRHIHDRETFYRGHPYLKRRPA